MAKIITAQEAASLIGDGMTVAVGGFGSYSSPDELLQAIADRYKETSRPKALTAVTGISPGNFKKDGGMGMSRLKDEGLIDTIITAHLGNAPDIAALVGENKVAGFLLPLGVMVHLMRAIAGKQPGVLTKVGLGTFADPRQEGCKANARALSQRREVVKLIQIDNSEYLFFPSFKIDICLIRGTYADAKGNISLKHEALNEAQLEVAAAVHNNGGTVIVQVEDIVEENTIPAKEVHIHRSLVDYIVRARPEYHMQCFEFSTYRPELAGEVRCPTDAIAPLELDVRKVIARRGAMELKPNCLINLGIGIPSGVGNVANEEGIATQTTLSLESGPVGGVPVAGGGFGGAVNPEAICGIPSTFDLYDGGILDMSFLGAAEVDFYGNVNVSKFGSRCTGPGGFINISQNTQKVIFMLSFTSGDSKIQVENNGLRIQRDGSGVKFVKNVQQITFSGDYALKTNQQVMYVTERAVFKLTKQGLMLVEIAPGVDLKQDVLDHMEFLPLIARPLSVMNPKLFAEGTMGLQF